MTEGEWLSSTNPQPMLDYLSGRSGERELRQFAAACCSRIWHLLPEDGLDFRQVFDLRQQLARDVPFDANRSRLYLPAAAATAAFAAAAMEHAGAEAQAFAAHSVYAASSMTGAGYADEEAVIWSVAADAAAADEATTLNVEREAQADLVRRILGKTTRSWHAIVHDRNNSEQRRRLLNSFAATAILGTR